jgi:hypothetical protein
MKSFKPLFQLAASHTGLLASTLVNYQSEHQIDEKTLMNFLKLHRLRDFHLLGLCKKPDNEPFSLLLQDVERIGAYIGCDIRALMRVVSNLPPTLIWQSSSKGDMWACDLPPFSATIISIPGPAPALKAFVNGPYGKSWSPQEYTKLANAQQWCEDMLEASSYRKTNDEYFSKQR